MDHGLEALRRRDEELARIRDAAQGPLIQPLHEAIRKAQEDALALQDNPELIRAAQERVSAEERLLASEKARIWRDKVLKFAPVRCARKAFELEPWPGVEAVRTWLDEGCPYDLVLRGGRGTGKTSAAVEAVRRWVEPEVELDEGGNARERPTTRKPCVSWLRPHALISAIEHSYDPSAPQLRKYVVIEDMGRETREEFVEAFCELLDREEHTILITTNLTKVQMRERYKDERIFDRLCERARPFDIPGESRRKRQGDF